MIIREMTIEDYQQVYDMWQQSPYIGNNQKDTYEDISTFLSHNPGCSFVAEKDGEIVGSILAGHDWRRGHIYHTIVKENCRCCGIGKKLVDSVVTAFRKLNLYQIDCMAMKTNQKGNEFWNKMGFKQKDTINYLRYVVQDK